MIVLLLCHRFNGKLKRHFRAVFLGVVAEMRGFIERGCLLLKSGMEFHAKF